MHRLSTPYTRIRPHYDVVVVGSGYGGAIAASRLARAGRTVCLLERGREFLPGEFPDTPPRALREMQTTLPAGRVGCATALFDFHLDEDISVLRGCGLGGTSLINANVSIKPDPRVFAGPAWPAGLREEIDTRLAEGYRRATEMLRPRPYPVDAPRLPKIAALERSGERLGEPVRRLDLNVTFEDLSQGNHVGVPQNACTSCGDCVSGCNHGAKNTTAVNYLPDAHNHGAEIFCEVLVRRVEAARDGYHVHYVPLGSDREKFNGPEAFVTADLVVLAAGTLGSTEILLRSQKHGLTLSRCIGKRFGGNADVLAFSYNNDEPVNAVGYGHRDPAHQAPVGPCITAVIDARAKTNVEDGVVIEEGVIPGALAPILPATLAAAAGVVGTSGHEGAVVDPRRAARVLESFLTGGRRGAVQHTQTYLVMGHDGADGRMYLDDGDSLRVSWPGVGNKPVFESIAEQLRQAAAANGGIFVKNPAWPPLMPNPLVTVHPLGGCAMGDDAASGVVNHKGQVFRGTSGTDVYDGLYVADGAIVPASLGVNPLLTISALAERICELIAEDRGWAFDVSLPSLPRTRRGGRRKVGVQFTEAMGGFFSTDEKEDYARGEAKGEQAGSSFRFVLTILAEDADALIRDRAHPASMVGTVEAPALSRRPLAVSEGRFRLFVDNRKKIETKNMVYRMVLTDVDGKKYFLHGFKVIRNDRGFDIWADTTTLYITLHEGVTDEGPVVGKGILHIRPQDFATQLTTMKALNARNALEAHRVLARFGEVFAGELLDTYGGVLAPNRVLSPRRAPRTVRPLRAPVPETHGVQTPDGVRLRLTRYAGGRKGPVVLAPGFGNRARVFALDTVDTSFVEYLVAHDYDVWLFDRRSSPGLLPPDRDYTLDDEAKQDWPAAIQAVRQRTGAADVQVVAHCMGAMTLLMAAVCGMGGVRHAVCSQVTTYFHTDVLNRLKARLRVARALRKVGIGAITTNPTRGWGSAAIEAALRLYPFPAGERCGDPVCHRIFGIFGAVYTHAQLDPPTHEAMDEIFGITNVAVLEHLLRILKVGHAVDARGKDVYLPHLDKLSFPIHFLAGMKNEICYPSASKRLYDELARRTPGRYTRIELPDYAHLDCFVGTHAARDVFPGIVAELDRFAGPS
jgi:cholesterol oxidase